MLTLITAVFDTFSLEEFINLTDVSLSLRIINQDPDYVILKNSFKCKRHYFLI